VRKKVSGGTKAEVMHWTEPLLLRRLRERLGWLAERLGWLAERLLLRWLLLGWFETRLVRHWVVSCSCGSPACGSEVNRRRHANLAREMEASSPDDRLDRGRGRELLASLAAGVS
jgi:hypothetical protein